MAKSSGMIDPKIFESLQSKIDDDAEVRDQIRAILQTLERQGRSAQSILSGAHSTPAAHRKYRSLEPNIPDLLQSSLSSNLLKWSFEVRLRASPNLPTQPRTPRTTSMIHTASRSPADMA
jgi:hypothetical protein